MKGINIEKEAGKSWKRDSLFNKVKLNELNLFDELVRNVLPWNKS